jgi:hypothetical protein
MRAYVFCRLFSVALLFLSVNAQVVASNGQLALKSGAPSEYRIQRGDTLWSIADMYLEQPWRWRELWMSNPQIDDPRLIYPGDTLILKAAGGFGPHVSLQRGRDIKLQPGIRASSLELAIPLIGLDQIGSFLRRNRVIDPRTAESAPYALGSTKGNLLSSPGDTIMVRGALGVTNGSDGLPSFGIYRIEKSLKDPITGELLGLEARVIGSARALQTADLGAEILEFEIRSVSEEIRQGDKVLPLRTRVLDAAYEPRPPSKVVENGYMISVEGGVDQVGALNTVVVNKGQRDGIEVGHVLEIFKVGKTQYDAVAGESVAFPDARAGLLMIFEVFDKSSLALVLKANRPLAVMDKVKTP